jgi:uncharacterized protein
MAPDGYELRATANGKGDGVFATRGFAVGETVVVGVIVHGVQKNHSHATQVSRFGYVELAGLASKVNHSCDPNCGVRTNPTGAPDLIARRFIAADEEVTFDYAMRNYSIEHFPCVCECGARTCRGCVTGWDGLSDACKRSYGSLVATYLLDIDGELALAADR